MKTNPLRRLASLLLTVALSPAAVAQTPPPLPLPTEEVPFITTPDHVTVAMLELAGVGAKDHVIDLGSGDGRIVITAAQRFGASGLGVEIVPDLVARSRDSALKAGVAARTRFEVQDLFATDLAPASVVTMYLLPEVNMALRPRLLALAPGTRIVSHDWDLGDWTPDRTLSLDVPQKAIGREKRSHLHLWVVPARVNGLWCGAGGAAMRIEQRHQLLQLSLERAGERRSYSGRVQGVALRWVGAGAAEVGSATVAGDDLLEAAAPGAAAVRWRRSAAAVCA